jgi:hypothetical protein
MQNQVSLVEKNGCRNYLVTTAIPMDPNLDVPNDKDLKTKSAVEDQVYIIENLLR